MEGLCPKCRSSLSKIVLDSRDYLHGSPGTFFVVECASCHFWYQNPIPPADVLARAYPDHYSPHTAASASVGSAYNDPGLLSYLKRFRGYHHLDTPAHFLSGVPFLNRWYHYNAGVYLMPDYISEGVLLDLGCGNGSRLTGLRNLGWKNLHGIERSSGASERAAALGFQIRCGAVESLAQQYPDGYFDVITCTMVLEHLADPFSSVRQIALKLKPGGQFLFSTINRKSLDFWIYGRYCRSLDLPRHMVWFQKKDIYEMLSGLFENIEVFHQRETSDYFGSSTSRAREERRAFDSLVMWFGEKRLRYVMPWLAWMGLTSRVSVRCRKPLQNR